MRHAPAVKLPTTSGGRVPPSEGRWCGCRFAGRPEQPGRLELGPGLEPGPGLYPQGAGWRPEIRRRLGVPGRLARFRGARRAGRLKGGECPG